MVCRGPVYPPFKYAVMINYHSIGTEHRDRINYSSYNERSRARALVHVFALSRSRRDEYNGEGGRGGGERDPIPLITPNFNGGMTVENPAPRK